MPAKMIINLFGVTKVIVHTVAYFALNFSHLICLQQIRLEFSPSRGRTTCQYYNLNDLSGCVWWHTHIFNSSPSETKVGKSLWSQW